MYHLSKVIAPKPHKSADTRKAHLSKTQPVTNMPGDSGANSFYDENSEPNSNMQSILIVNEEVDSNQHFKTEGNESDATEVNLFTALSMSFYERKPEPAPNQRPKKEAKNTGFQHFRPNMKLELSTPAKKSGGNSIVTPRGNDKTELFSIVELNSAPQAKKKLMSPDNKVQRDIKRVVRPVLEEKKLQRNNVTLDSKDKSNEKVLSGVKRKIDMGAREYGTAAKKQNLTTAIAQKQIKKEDNTQKIKRSPIISTKTPKTKENAVRKEVAKYSQENHADIANKASSANTLDAKKPSTGIGSLPKRETGVMSFKGVHRLPLHRLQIDLTGPTINSQRLVTDPGSIPQSTRSERGVKDVVKKDTARGKENLNVVDSVHADRKQVGNKRHTLDPNTMKNKAPVVKPLEGRFNDYDFISDNRLQPINSAREHYAGGPGWQNYFKTTLSHVLEPSDSHNRERNENHEKGYLSARAGGHNTAR